ncbi:MAG: VWA domain-containing protein [Clostridia bacterium]|nr:VWA domain-containing protein [Clostridia bacterium]
MSQMPWNNEDVRKQIIQINEEGGGGLIVHQAEPHVACCLLVDTSSSMRGEKLRRLNAALAEFKQQVCEDPLSARRVDVCVIEFNDEPSVVTPFCPIREFEAPVLTAKRCTGMGKGIRFALEAVHEQVHQYHTLGVECYQPFVVMLTDGAPTDDISQIPAMIRECEQAGRYGRLRFHAIGVGDEDQVNYQVLNQLCHRVVKLQENDFSSLFRWISQSMQIISHSQAGVGTPPIQPLSKNMVLPWND